MFESLFGAETPLAVRFFIAFIVVFALIGATAWLVRRFGTARLGGQAARGRQPRLAVIEAGAVDGRRKLVLVRRDNIEHLLMIGGPTDIVIEQNILRTQVAREAPPVRSDAAWPTEPTPRARPVVMDEPHDEPHVTIPTPVSAAPPPPRRPVRTPTPAPTPVATDPLAGHAAEMSTRDADALHRLTASDSPRRTAPTLDGVRPADAPV
ncbi:MAG: flagellar biosynthetic protein FliO, partial [Pseudorhodoplanes sp.]